MTEIDFAKKRKNLAESLIRQRILRSPRVIAAMLKVPREEFVPHGFREMAYDDSPVPIMASQTISAPHMVAMMCEALELAEGQKVLEVGTGSGYHAAVVAELVAPQSEARKGRMFTLEIKQELAQFAHENLERLGYGDVITVLKRDGSIGLPEEAPFERILVTAAAPTILDTLVAQLTTDGIMVIPVGGAYSFQELMLVRKNPKGKMATMDICSVAFVPLLGKYGWSER